MRDWRSLQIPICWNGYTMVYSKLRIWNHHSPLQKKRKASPLLPTSFSTSFSRVVNLHISRTISDIPKQTKRHIQKVADHGAPRLAVSNHDKTAVKDQVHGDHLPCGFRKFRSTDAVNGPPVVTGLYNLFIQTTGIHTLTGHFKWCHPMFRASQLVNFEPRVGQMSTKSS